MTETASYDLRDSHSHGLADLRREVRQRYHCDGSREYVPDGAHSPFTESLLRKAGGGTAADIVGGKGEGYHEQAHAAACKHIVAAVLDLELADDETDKKHTYQICDYNDKSLGL